MPDFALDVQDYSPFGVLSNFGIGQPCADLIATAGATVGSSLTYTANQAMFSPVLVRSPISVYALAVSNFGTVAGNFDLGIYDNERNRLVSLGSTAQSGANAPQVTAIATLLLTPGLYYLAMVCSSASATYAGGSGSSLWRPTGCATQNSALPLPSSATFAAASNISTPLICAAIAGSVF